MKTTIEVDADELKAVEAFRVEKARKEAEALEARRKEAEKSTLEARFRAAASEARLKINLHLELARAELKKAIQISEEHGIPFNSDIVEVDRTRRYTPQSIERWQGISYEVKRETQVYFDEFEEKGCWEYWNMSGLGC